MIVVTIVIVAALLVCLGLIVRRQVSLQLKLSRERARARSAENEADEAEIRLAVKSANAILLRYLDTKVRQSGPLTPSEKRFLLARLAAIQMSFDDLDPESAFIETLRKKIVAIEECNEAN
jgi:hypothetical protein